MLSGLAVTVRVAGATVKLSDTGVAAECVESPAWLAVTVTSWLPCVAAVIVKMTLGLVPERLAQVVQPDKVYVIGSADELEVASSVMG
jgi:hypothetical protein